MKKIGWIVLVILMLLLSVSLVVCSSNKENSEDSKRSSDGVNDDIYDDDVYDDDVDDDTDDDVDDDTTDDDADDDTGEATISGTITYTGEYANSSSGKKVYLYIFDVWPSPPGYPPICTNQAIVPTGGFPISYGPFECNVSEGEYYPFAYLDYNENGIFDNSLEPVDVPSTAYPVTIKPGYSITINFNLIDTYCSKPATVFGTVHYTGIYSGSSIGKKIYVTIYDQPIGNVAPIYSYNTIVSSDGFPVGYSFSACLNGNFYPAAYLDYNGNGKFDLGTEPWHPYNDPVSITFGDTIIVNFTLQDTGKQ